MSRKPQTDPKFHDNSDPRCKFHQQRSGHARPERTCPACAEARK